MLALLDEPVAIVQAAEESDDLGEHQFNVLVRLAHAILRQIVVDVVGAPTGEASAILGNTNAISADSTNIEESFLTIEMTGTENLFA